MKNLTKLLTLLLFILAGSSAFSQFTQPEMVKEWQRAKDYTKEYLDAMPADGYSFKPTPEIRSYAQQMLHLADVNFYFAASASGTASPMGKESAEKTVTPTKEAVTKSVMDSYDFVISSLKVMSAAQLEETATAEGMSMKKSALFAKAFEHQTHHRGQCTIYLRLKGVKPPGEKLF